MKNFKHCSMQTNLSFINFHHSQHYWYTLIKYIWLKNYIIVVVFAIHWHESAMAVHEFPILNLPPTYLPILSLWVVPVHQPWAPCLMHRTWTGTSHHFQAFIPPSPSPTESNSLFFTSVSLLLSYIKGHRYHLSKFHVYALRYCIGVFLSELTLLCIIGSSFIHLIRTDSNAFFSIA